jgi:hypothetical protein
VPSRSFEVDLEERYRHAWRTTWKQGREPRDEAGPENEHVEAMVREADEETEAWAKHLQAHEVPEGVAYCVDVMTTGSANATPLPDTVLNGPHDRRLNVVREQPGERETRDR